MANNENPLGIFPFSKEQLETLLARGTLVDAARKYYRNAARLLHPDQGGKDFVEYGLPVDGVFKVLNGAFQQIETADASQLERWVKSYGNGGGISEEQVARILAGAQVLRDQRDAFEAEKAGLERKLADLVAAVGRGQNIPENRLREILAGRGGADPARVRDLETQLADAQRQYQQSHGNLGAAVRDRDSARRQARDLNIELDAMRRDKIAKQREADTYKGQRDLAQTNAVKYERIANAHKRQADGLEQTLKEVRAAEAQVRTEYAQAVDAATQQIRRFGEQITTLRQGLKEAVRPDVGDTPHLLAHLLVYELLRAGAVPSPAYRGAFIQGARAYATGAYKDAQRHLAPFLKNATAPEDAVGVYLAGLTVEAQNQGPDGKPLNAGAAKWAAGLKYRARKMNPKVEQQMSALETLVPMEYLPFFIKGLTFFVEGNYAEAKNQLAIFRGSGRGGIDSAAGMYVLGEVVSAESTSDGARKYAAALKYRAKRLDGQVEAKLAVFLAPPKPD